MEVVAIPGRDGQVRAARARILTALLARLDELAMLAVAEIRREIPAYASRHDEHFVDDVTDQVRLAYRAILTALLDERAVTLDDMALVRPVARRRAQAGFALADYINAFRVELQVLWDAIVAGAGAEPAAHEAALNLAAPVMRYINLVSTQAGNAYVEFQQSALADADRDRRDLLEILLSGRFPTGAPLTATARACGLGPDSPMLVVAAASAAQPVGPDTTGAWRTALARADRTLPEPLVVVRQGEIVAVAVLRSATDAGRFCRRLEGAHRRLSAAGTSLVVGASTAAAGVAEMPRVYEEARTALAALAGRPGVLALPRLTPFAYLVLRADGTARGLVDAKLSGFLDHDSGRGGPLSATVRAFADADLNLRLAAERLHIHPNTALYRLRRVQELTGRNPRRFADLLDLLVAVELHHGRRRAPVPDEQAGDPVRP